MQKSLTHNQTFVYFDGNMAGVFTMGVIRPCGTLRSESSSGKKVGIF
ncbi:MAG: hypothetical protein WCP14_03615 [bacterium]